MPPLVIEDEHDMLLAITEAGRMLMFPVDSLPQLSKGQGNGIVSSPSAEAARKAMMDWRAQARAAAAKHSGSYPCREAQNQMRPEELQRWSANADAVASNARPAAYRSH